MPQPFSYTVSLENVFLGLNNHFTKMGSVILLYIWDPVFSCCYIASSRDSKAACGGGIAPLHIPLVPGVPECAGSFF